MPVVNITTWTIQDEEQIKGLLEDVTYAVQKNTGAPLDKISVFILEVPPSRWADAGVIGNCPEFQEKSRRTSYEE